MKPSFCCVVVLVFRLGGGQGFVENLMSDLIHLIQLGFVLIEFFKSIYPSAANTIKGRCLGTLLTYSKTTWRSDWSNQAYLYLYSKADKVGLTFCAEYDGRFPQARWPPLPSREHITLGSKLLTFIPCHWYPFLGMPLPVVVQKWKLGLGSPSLKIAISSWW